MLFYTVRFSRFLLSPHSPQVPRWWPHTHPKSLWQVATLPSLLTKSYHLTTPGPCCPWSLQADSPHPCCLWPIHATLPARLTTARSGLRHGTLYKRSNMPNVLWSKQLWQLPLRLRSPRLTVSTCSGLSLAFHSPTEASHRAVGRARARAGLTAICEPRIPQPKRRGHRQGGLPEAEPPQQQLTVRPKGRNKGALSGSWGTALSDSLPASPQAVFQL